MSYTKPQIQEAREQQANKCKKLYVGILHTENRRQRENHERSQRKKHCTYRDKDYHLAFPQKPGQQEGSEMKYFKGLKEKKNNH